jgi:hypothetical protein
MRKDRPRRLADAALGRVRGNALATARLPPMPLVTSTTIRRAAIEDVHPNRDDV